MYQILFQGSGGTSPTRRRRNSMSIFLIAIAIGVILGFVLSEASKRK